MLVDIEQPESLLAYLRQTGRLEAQASSRVLPGGVSNKTVLVTRPAGSWVIKQALEKLRVKEDWLSDPWRIHREALGLRYLADMLPGMTPSYLFEDFELHLLAMTAVPQPHYNWKEMLLRGELHEAHVRQFAQCLGDLHHKAYLQRDTLAEIFADTSFFESLRLEPYYLFAAKQVSAAVEFLNKLVETTRVQRHTLVHGDYSPKNILIFEDRLILLDYEVIHWGDPAFDVGFAMTHFLSKAHFLENLKENFMKAATLFWQTYYAAYDDAFGDDFEVRCVRHTLGCLLARVSGRSPLEYLNEAQKYVQLEVTLSLLESTTFQCLLEGFKKGLARS